MNYIWTYIYDYFFFIMLNVILYDYITIMMCRNETKKAIY